MKIEDLQKCTVDSIYMNNDRLTIVTLEKGPISFEVYGDCCSNSYFCDFYGVQNLLGRKILTVEEVSLSPGDVGYRPETWEAWEEGVVAGYGECIRVYGYRFTVSHDVFGLMSAVVSFRNSSNGYYGGWMEATEIHLLNPNNRIVQDTILP